MARKIFSFLTEFIIIVTFLGLSIITFLDLFQLLDPSDIWTDWSQQLTKITLLAVALIGLSQVLERRLHLFEIRDKVVNVGERLDDLQVAAAPSAEFVPNRREMYRMFKDSLLQLPIGTEILVTHFEKLQSIPYDSGEIPEEIELMRVWEQRVKNKELLVYQIVHVSSQRDLKEVRDRIAKYRDTPTYLINVMIGAPVRPYFDMAILGDFVGLMDFSSDYTSARVADVGFHITDSTMVSFLGRYFRIWWSNYSIPVKTRDSVNEDFLNKLQRQLPAEENEAKMDEAFDFALKLSADPWLENSIKQITNAHQNVRNLNEKIFENKSRELIKECLENIVKLSYGSLVMNKDGVLELINIMKSTVNKIEATSYVQNINFWNTNMGKNLMAVNEEAINRGVQVTRVFIISPEEEETSQLLDILDQHVDLGVKVFVVNMNDISKDLLSDFLIQDDKLVFRNEKLIDGNELNIISIDSRDIGKARGDFQLIMIRAKPHMITNKERRLPSNNGAGKPDKKWYKWRR